MGQNKELHILFLLLPSITAVLLALGDCGRVVSGINTGAYFTQVTFSCIYLSVPTVMILIAGVS